jgi:hypothetical protein
MTISPRDYDLNELREMARKRGDVGEDGRPEDPTEME